MKNHIYLAFLLLASACGTRQEQTSQTAVDSVSVKDSVVAAPPVAVVKKDQALDALGVFMAGMPQRDSTIYTGLEKEPLWQDFKKSMDANWSRVYKERLEKMQLWQSENFGRKLNDSLHVFYPFSGPDFLHAYYLYPGASDYTMAGLEPVMLPPSLDTLSVKYRDRFLDTLGHSLRDIFMRSFFMTKNMAKDLKQVSGVVPLLYFFIERTGHELLEQEFFYLDSEGNPVTTDYKDLHKAKTQGVKLTFRNLQTQHISRLSYLSLDVSNDGLNKTPEFEKFVNGKKPFNTFIKSASYLMHRPTFSRIVNLILQNSESIFQDDTGIPYRDLQKRLDFELALYGEYTKPVQLFRATRYQPDLDSAYQLRKAEPLPFAIGYHWDTNKANYMLLKKSTANTAR